MYLYLDSLDIDEIERYEPFIQGVTSTPTFAVRDNLADYGIDRFKDILNVLARGKTLHISAPFAEADRIVEYMAFVTTHIRSNSLVFKLPCTETGVKVARRYGHQYNIGLHLVYTLGQVMMANDTPAKYHYLLVGRGTEYGYDMKRLALLSRCPMLASIRNVDMVYEYADTKIPLTVPPKVMRALTECEHTENGQAQFIKDFEAGNKDGFGRAYRIDGTANGKWV